MRVFVLLREFREGAPSDPVGAYATLEAAQRAAAASAEDELVWEADWNECWRAQAPLHDYAVYRLPLQARWERRKPEAEGDERRTGSRFGRRSVPRQSKDAG